MRREASLARAPMVQPIDPFLPETGWPCQIDPAYRPEPAQAADKRAARSRPIEEKWRPEFFTQFSIGDPSADGVLQRGLERLAGKRGLHFDSAAPTGTEYVLP